MSGGSRGCLHRNSQHLQFGDSRSMHAPVVSSSATAAVGFRDAHPSLPTSFQENGKQPVAAENRNGSLDHSQSSDNSRLRSSHSPSALGSGSQASQASQTTVEGVSEPLSGIAANAPHKPFDVSLRTSASIPQRGPTMLEDYAARGISALNEPRDSFNPALAGNGITADSPPISYNLAGSNAQMDDASSTPRSQLQSKMGSRPRVESISGQKRTAAGEIKALSEEAEPHDSDLGAAWRHRSKSIGSASHGSRIAELSMHLRTRLSYAAAKVEKSWQRDGQAQVPFRLRQSGSPTPTPSSIKRAWPQGHMQGNISSEHTTLSASNSSTASHFHPPNEQLPKSPAAKPPILSPNHFSQRYTAPTSPTKSYPAPKLAPPVDIISGAGSGRRRRPNPNEIAGRLRYSPYSGHRRHHSQQEFGASKLTADSHPALVPGTPPLRPSMHKASTPFATHNGHSRSRTHSQSTLMEQDAIETLLFMSSPKNSGYHPSPRLRPDTIPKSIAPPVTTSSNPPHNQNKPLHMESTNGSSSSSRFRDQAFGLEAHAGDEIDRMLDQMEDSDSDDGRDFPSNHHSQTSATSHSVNSSQARNGSWRRGM